MSYVKHSGKSRKSRKSRKRGNQGQLRAQGQRGQPRKQGSEGNSGEQLVEVEQRLAQMSLLITRFLDRLAGDLSPHLEPLMEQPAEATSTTSRPHTIRPICRSAEFDTCCGRLLHPSDAGRSVPPTRLSPAVAATLQLLSESPKRRFSADEIAAWVSRQTQREMTTSSVRQVIHALREALGETAADHGVIRMDREVGYYYAPGIPGCA